MNACRYTKGQLHGPCFEAPTPPYVHLEHLLQVQSIASQSLRDGRRRNTPLRYNLSSEDLEGGCVSFLPLKKNRQQCPAVGWQVLRPLSFPSLPLRTLGQANIKQNLDNYYQCHVQLHWEVTVSILEKMSLVDTTLKVQFKS